MSHDGGFTCAQAEQGAQHMAAAISGLRDELRGEREKYRQVVEINNANERAYLAKTDALRAELDAKHATLVRVADGARALRAELARTRFLSVMRGKLAEGWAKMLDEVRAELGPVALACDAMPDITISKWACTPGGHWNRVHEALRARRAAQGLDVDAADPETAFDEHGWLKQPREVAR